MLPFNLLIVSLALAAYSLPVESVELRVLTPDNFQSTISKGLWFVEHFSPYCPHCRDFAPIWQKLVDQIEALPDPPVHFAQINCAVHGDFCNANDVAAYPQMNLYREGDYVDKFKGARSLDRIRDFLDDHIDVPHSSSVVSTDTQTQVDKEIGDVPPEKRPNQQGMVMSVGESNFKAVIDAGPVFIKYFAPWCGHCKKLAPIWTHLASDMREKLNIAEVNCDAHPALCKSQDVQGYPMLFFYSGGSGKGGRKTEYTGGRKFDQLKRFAEMATAPAVSAVEPVDYEHYVKDNSVLYLLLHPASDQHARKQLSESAHVLLGSPPVLTSTSTSLRSRLSVPAQYASTPVLLAVKDHVPSAYTALFPFPAGAEANADTLTSWLLSQRLPTTLELTQDTFQPVMNAPHRPLVVLAAVGSQDRGAAAEHITELGREWRTRRMHAEASNEAPREVVFTWMDAQRWDTWLKSMYGIRQDNLPAVVLADHQRLVYYDTDLQGHKLTLDSETLFSAIEGVFKGKVSYKHSENFIERIARSLNNTMTSLEALVLNNPIRTALFFLGCLVAFVIAIKRFIADDVSPYTQDQKHSHKSQNRLD